MPADRGHSELSASTSTRWTNCLASVRMNTSRDGQSSIYAQEGTDAHGLAQLCLTKGHEANRYVGQTIGSTTVTEAMAAHIRLYVETCRRLMASCSYYRIEQSFDLAALDPPVPMYGTADFVAYSAKRFELYIVDLKYGKGVWVPAKDNTQLKYYALGVALAIRKPIESVVMSIVQPRASGDPIRTAVIDYVELGEWALFLMQRARGTQAPDAPLAAGSWCTFCPSRPSCPAYQTTRIDDARKQFAAVDATPAGA